MNGSRIEVKGSRAPASRPRSIASPRRSAGSALCVAIGLLLACRTADIQDFVEIPLSPDQRAASIEAVDEAIWRAGRKQGWEVERSSPGSLRATLRWKRHAAAVSIEHDRQLLHVRYADSRKLGYDGKRIHVHYNRLVHRLVEQILREPVY